MHKIDLYGHKIIYMAIKLESFFEGSLPFLKF